MPDLPTPLLGAGNIPLALGSNDPPDTQELNRRIAEAGELGLDAVRVHGEDNALQANGVAFQRAQVILTALRDADRPLQALLAFRTNDPASYTPAQLAAAGAAWGAMLNARPDLAPTVVGFSIQNAWCNAIGWEYQRVLLETGGDYEAAEDAAREEADRQLPIITEFCRGVRDARPSVARVPAGLPDAPWGGLERECLRWLVETGAYIQLDGTPPVLTGVGLHFYANRRDFTITWNGAPTVETRDGWTFGGLADDLLGYAFDDPGVVAAMPLYVQELNVKQTSFGWSLGADPGEPEQQQTPEFVAARAAMVVLMDEVFGDGRVRYGGVYSPWPAGTGSRYLVRVDYAYNAPQPDYLTPSGAAVRGYVRPWL